MKLAAFVSDFVDFIGSVLLKRSLSFDSEAYHLVLGDMLLFDLNMRSFPFC